MITIPGRALRRGGILTALLAAGALLIAGCSSSKSGVDGGGTAPAGGGGNTVTIETHNGPMGTFLTDGSGKTLYMFASDTATKSSCSGVCLTYWPPLTSSGTPNVTGGVTASKISTITGSNGSKQVAYAGHPLYYFKLDSAAGDTKGQGSDNFGAKWWLVAPSGDIITGSGASSSSSAASSTSGGGGY